MITVVNKHKHKPTPNDVYIGRGSPLGNRYTHIKEGTKAEFVCETRTDAIEAHTRDLMLSLARKDKAICDALNDIYVKAKNGDVNLVCFCAPQACHGDTIKRMIDAQIFDRSELGKIVFELRECTFHCTDEEAAAIVDEAIQHNPRMLELESREYYISMC